MFRASSGATHSVPSGNPLCLVAVCSSMFHRVPAGRIPPICPPVADSSEALTKQKWSSPFGWCHHAQARASKRPKALFVTGRSFGLRSASGTSSENSSITSSPQSAPSTQALAATLLVERETPQSNNYAIFEELMEDISSNQ